MSVDRYEVDGIGDAEEIGPMARHPPGGTILGQPSTPERQLEHDRLHVSDPGIDHRKAIPYRVAARLHFVYTEVMPSADTTTVRVRRPDSERLQSLAKARQTAVIDVLHAAIDALERQEFLRGLGQDYQRLREDPERWEQYLAERQEWDALA